MKIRIEYEVPDDDCIECMNSSMDFSGALHCELFQNYYLNKSDNGKFQRCQPCIEAEVKEGE